jgi:hypothetical protein
MSRETCNKPEGGGGVQPNLEDGKMAIEYQYCSECGITSDERQKECVWCGANMISECGNCKAGFESAGFMNCPACGVKIEAPIKTFPADNNSK